MDTVVDEFGLKACTDLFLRSPDKLKSWLNLADTYMQAFVKDKESFLMPKAHAFMAPVVEAYAKDIDGFVQYLVSLRDAFDRDSRVWEDVQTIHRRVNGRYIQQVRRERSGRALAKAQEIHGDAPFHEKLQWSSRLEHEWAQRRLAFLEKQRIRIKEKHIPADLRAEFLAEFWDIIDTEIFEGKVPGWS